MSNAKKSIHNSMLGEGLVLELSVVECGRLFGHPRKPKYRVKGFLANLSPNDLGESPAMAHTGESGQAFEYEYCHGAGIHYNWHRWYDPDSGRYLSVDPVVQRSNGAVLGYAAMQPELLAPYAYAANNPLGYVDRDGAFAVPAIIVGALTALQLASDTASFSQASQDFANNPSLENFGWLAFSVAALITPVPSGGGKAGCEAAESAFTHKLPYHDKVRARALEDPRAHNFPYSFDDAILGTNPKQYPNGYQMYELEGSMNGNTGAFQIGVDKNGIIDHRVFRSK